MTFTDHPATTTPADQQLKDRHRTMWGSGDYPRMVTDFLEPLGIVLADAIGARPGLRLLDIAAGTGNASLAAAARGADVVASDLTPTLLQAGQRQAQKRGIDTVTWREADAEALPFADAEFDAVMSSIGVMFAPHHQAAADELTRVCRPGGRIGLITWTPDGVVGRMFATMKPYAPTPPPGVRPPPQWGDLDHVRDLIGDAVVDLVAQRQELKVDAFASGAAYRDYFKTNYGPTIAVYRAIADDPQRTVALDEELAAFYDDRLVEGACGWEYLLITATRAEPVSSW